MVNVGSALASGRRVLVPPASFLARRLDDRSKILYRAIGYFSTTLSLIKDTIRVFKYVDACLFSDIEENFYYSNVKVLSSIRFNGCFQGPRLLRSSRSADQRVTQDRIFS